MRALDDPAVVRDSARRERRRDALDPLFTELAHGLPTRVAVRAGLHATQRFGEPGFGFLLGAKASDPPLASLAFVVGLEREHVAVALAPLDNAAAQFDPAC